MEDNHEVDDVARPALRVPWADGATQRLFASVTGPSDYFALIEQQVQALRDQTKMVGDIMNGRQSAHAFAVLEIEFRWGELGWQRDAVVSHRRRSGSDFREICQLIVSLERAAEALGRIIVCFKGTRQLADQGSRRMLMHVEQAIQSLSRGNRRLAKGCSAANLDLAATISIAEQLLSQCAVGQRSTPAEETGKALEPCASGGITLGHECAAQDALVRTLHENLFQIGSELMLAATFLRDWLLRMTAIIQQPYVASVGQAN